MRKSCVSDTDVHGTTSYVKSSIIIGVSTAQVRTGVVHVLRENDSRLLRLRVSRFARNDSSLVSPPFWRVFIVIVSYLFIYLSVGQARDWRNGDGRRDELHEKIKSSSPPIVRRPLSVLADK